MSHLPGLFRKNLLWVGLILLTTAVVRPEPAQTNYTAVISNFAVVGRLTLPGEVTAVAVHNQWLYAVGPDNFFVVQIADSTQPTLWGHLVEPFGAANDLAITGAYALISAGENGLIAIDISDPAQPVYAQQTALAGTAGPLLLHNQLAYVIQYEQGFSIWDIADPVAPHYIGGATDLTANQFALSASRLYLVGNPSSEEYPFPAGALYIYDVTDPAQPERLGATHDQGADYPYAPKYRSVYIQEQFANVSAQFRLLAGIIRYDVSDPVAPTAAQPVTFPLLEQTILRENWLYGLGDNQVNVAQLANGSSPQLIAQYGDGRALSGLAVQDGLVFTAAQNELLILQPLTNHTFLPIIGVANE
jgi:hypothetical protein